MRLVDHVRAHLAPVTTSAVGPLIARGGVFVDGRPGRMDEAVTAASAITIARALVAASDWTEPEATPLVIAYEDADLLVVDKPPGMHVHPLGPHRTGTLLNALVAHAGARPDVPWAAWRPHPVHRLDRGASGLVIVAKRAAVHEELRALLEAHRIERRYVATVHGVIADDARTIDAPLGRDPANDYRRAVVAAGQPAITHLRVTERTADRTVLALELATGRTHQIRAHLASIGHPILGDTLYGSTVDTGLAIALRAVSLTIPRIGHPERKIAADGPW